MMMKRDMEDRRFKSKKDLRPLREVYFVDPVRRSGVVIGEKDIGKEMKKTMKKKQITMSFKDIENDYKLLCKRGNYLLNFGDLKSSMELLDRSIDICKEKEINDGEPFIVRSKCRLILGMVKEAADDADEALKIDKSSIAAMKAKAEAMYQYGEFEQALVQYERILKMCPEYKIGDMKKKRNVCVDTIITAFKDYTFDPDLVSAAARDFENPVEIDSVIHKNKVTEKKRKKCTVTKTVNNVIRITNH